MKKKVTTIIIQYDNGEELYLSEYDFHKIEEAAKIAEKLDNARHLVKKYKNLLFSSSESNSI